MTEIGRGDKEKTKEKGEKREKKKNLLQISQD